ncbi:MAG: hypothetical protein CO150_00475, partial [Nitrospirae bacterium CG_4_9_14_3_um_filter_53_35]
MESSTKILVVDDDKAARKSIRSILEQEGYLVLEAEDGASGLQQVKTENPDLVLLDIVMPRVDGIKVCKSIKSNPDYKKIPILMTTSMGSKEDIIRGLKSGADDYIVKPYDKSELLARIKTFLRAGNLLKQL